MRRGGTCARLGTPTPRPLRLSFGAGECIGRRVRDRLEAVIALTGQPSYSDQEAGRVITILDYPTEKIADAHVVSKFQNMFR
jgi:hypothetical protein